MNNLEIRNQVKSAYESEKWRKKVDRMTEGQLYAIFRRLKQSGRIK